MNILPNSQIRWVLLSALLMALLAASGSGPGKSIFLICLLGLGPMLAALQGSPRHIVLLSFFSLVLVALMGWRDHIWLTPNHLTCALVVFLVCGGAVHLSLLRHQAAETANKRAALIRLLEQVAETANNAVRLDAALKSCLRAICTHTRWAIGHAYVQSLENPAVQVSSRLWHPDHHWAHSGTPAARFREASEAIRFTPGEGLCGRVLELGKPVWCRDAGADPAFLRGAELRAAGLRGYFAFPVFAGGETAAVLEFFSREPRLPDPDLLDLLAHIGALLGRVVERLRAVAAVSESEARFRALAQSAADAVIIVDESDRIAFWNPSAEKMFGHSRAQAQGREMTLILPARYHGAHHEAMARLRAAGEHEIIGRLLQPEGLHRDGREFPIEYSFSRWQSGGRKFFGATLRDASERAREMERQRRAADRMRSSAALLQEQSVRDPLTGLFNRRYLEASLEREINRASRRGRPVALVMIDLDYFKRYNDSLGHPAGDALLREFCGFLSGRTRGEDVLCRYGGDEFTLLMPETTVEQAAHWAEQLRTPLKGLPLMNQPGREVTVSFGVAEYPRHAATAAGLIAAADGALYGAKEAGRNRVMTAPAPRAGSSPDPLHPETAH